MPRKIRIEYAGAIYHVMSHGDRREEIFYDDVDRHDFLKTIGEACQKADFQVHAYCLMPNHFHLVMETPNANLVAGMKWLLSSYTLRLNHRRKLVGHVFSGRYKALLVDGSGDGYLKTVCDYVHLNPARAHMLKSQDPLLAYPWSSMIWYLAAPKYRPSWMRTDRLLGAHGIQKDDAQGRKYFAERLEARRRAEREDEEEWKPIRRGWCVGSSEFREQLLEKMERSLGENHAGELRSESAQAKAERIIGQELRRLGWNQADLVLRLKGDPAKMALAGRLRKETTLPMTWIAQRLSMGTAKSARARLHKWKENSKLIPTRDDTLV